MKISIKLAAISVSMLALFTPSSYANLRRKYESGGTKCKYIYLRAGASFEALYGDVAPYICRSGDNSMYSMSVSLTDLRFQRVPPTLNPNLVKIGRINQDYLLNSTNNHFYIPKDAGGNYKANSLIRLSCSWRSGECVDEIRSVEYVYWGTPSEVVEQLPRMWKKWKQEKDQEEARQKALDRSENSSKSNRVDWRSW